MPLKRLSKEKVEQFEVQGTKKRVADEDNLQEPLAPKERATSEDNMS